MKHIENWLCIALTSILLFPLVNCSNEDDTPDPRPIISSLTVSESDVIIQGSSSWTFEIKTSSTWRIDVPENAFRWLIIKIIEGAGNGFTADAYLPGGTWDQISQQAIDALLTNMEPYKTWGNYLRIIRIAAYSEESGISEHKSTTSPLKIVKTKFNTSYDNLGNSTWTGLANTNDGAAIFNRCLEQRDLLGARSYKSGIWRPQETATLMEDNRFLMDAPSRYFLVKRLVEAAGETLTWERFVNKDYDRANINLTRSDDFEDPTIPPLHEPIIIYE